MDCEHKKQNVKIKIYLTAFFECFSKWFRLDGSTLGQILGEMVEVIMYFILNFMTRRWF